MSTFNLVNVLHDKSQGSSLSSDSIRNFVSSVFSKTVDDAQIGAFLMAVKINGMNPQETADLSRSMAEFSEKFDFSHYSWKDKVVDKHSTGGVGDKISHILAPILAACGLKVPMISGRGLGITGGTIDKLEAIKGYSSSLQTHELGGILDTAGFFIIGQTDDMVPVDKCLYAIRDVTATVASVPLITASILCKKKIEDLQVLVMDIKYGKGTFMKNVEEGEILARSMIDTGKSMGMEVICLLDDMNSPLGYCMGNAIEMAEVFRALNGTMSPDIEEIIEIMVLQLMKSVHKQMSEEDIRKSMLSVLENGKALHHLELMLMAQGVEADLARRLCEHKLKTVEEYVEIMGHKSGHETEILTKEGGYVDRIDAEIIGTLVRDLKGGRYRKGDVIDYAVGVEVLAKEGSECVGGQAWAKIFHNAPLDKSVVEFAQSALTMSAKQPKARKRIAKIISK